MSMEHLVIMIWLFLLLIYEDVWKDNEKKASTLFLNPTNPDEIIKITKKNT